MHPGQAQRPDEWERIAAWRGQTVRPDARGAWQVPSPSGHTQPGDLVDPWGCFRGLPLPRPLSEFQGTLAVLTTIRGSTGEPLAANGCARMWTRCRDSPREDPSAGHAAKTRLPTANLVL